MSRSAVPGSVVFLSISVGLLSRGGSTYDHPQQGATAEVDAQPDTAVAQRQEAS